MLKLLERCILIRILRMYQKLRHFFKKMQTKPKAWKKIHVKFPSIPRDFPETLFSLRITQPVVYALALSLVLVFTIHIILSDIQKNRAALLSLRQEKTVLLQKREIWKKNIEKYKGYRDGYFQLALLEYQLGNVKEAREYTTQALAIDPNFYQGKILLDKIGK